MKIAPKLRKSFFFAVLMIPGIAVSGTVVTSHFDQGLVYYSEGDYKSAIAEFNQAVKAGEGGAEYMLMKIHNEGKGGASDHQSFQWALKAAETGIRQAQYQVAQHYLNGEATEVNYEQALHWYQLAADQGHPLANQQLAKMYEAGLGVAADKAKADRLYVIAASELDVFAQKGDPDSQYRLAQMYEHGQGVKNNPQAALAWYEKAASQDLLEAQYHLGIMLANGAGVETNRKQAMYWLERAANQGHKKAGSALAQLKNATDADVAFID